MLVLSRKKGETIQIGSDIFVTVVKIKSGGIVRLGIEADKSIPVYRKEIYDATKNNCVQTHS